MGPALSEIKLQPPDFEWVAQVSILSKRLAGASEGWKERAFGLYPLHEPRFPVESRGFPALHAPFLKERRTRGPVQSCVQEIGGIDGCPILRALCEGWDSQVSPPDLPRKADLFLRRPGFLLAKGSRPEHPGLKSETWATHSMFVRAIFIFLEWTAGPSILLFGTVRRAAARRPFRAAQSAAPG